MYEREKGKEERDKSDKEVRYTREGIEVMTDKTSNQNQD